MGGPGESPGSPQNLAARAVYAAWLFSTFSFALSALAFARGDGGDVLVVGIRGDRRGDAALAVFDLDGREHIVLESLLNGDVGLKLLGVGVELALHDLGVL